MMIVLRNRSLASIAFVAALLTAGCGEHSRSSDAVAAGQAAVTSRDCASCHQDESGSVLAGSTTPQPGTSAYPQNLTPDPTGVGEWSDDQLVKAILDGIDDENEPLCPPMPHYRDEGMTETEARNIVAYLRTLPAVSREIPESECPPLKGGD
jgi:mono/diheme cytochrome c family protein